MTVSTTISRVSYSGNGSTVTFTVPFYFIYSTDLKVYKTSSANVQTLLVEGTDYTVTGAGVISGGSITCTTAPSSDYTIIIYRDPDTTQLVDYQANDPFPAETHERALDKLTMIAQRLNDVNDRSFHISDGDTSGATLEIASPEANYLIGWNSTGDALQNVDPSTLATIVSYATAYADTFTGDGTTTSWTLSRNPAVLYNLDVSINGVTQVPVTDYTLSGTTFTTTTAAPLNAVILVKYKEGLPNYSGDSQDVRFVPAGTGAVTTTVQAKLRETVSVLDFDADPTGSTDSTTAFNNAKLYVAGLGGGIVYIPFGTYVLTNFDVDYQSVLFQGETSGYSYESETNSVRLVPSATATYVARLKGTRGAITTGAGAYSGFKNVQFKYAAGTCNYGLFIDTGSTILEEVDIEGFPYGCVLATYVNSNRFTNCSFTLNTKVGFAVPDSLSASTYMFPDVSNIPTGTNVSTAFSMLGCTFRQNDFGMVVRETTNVSIQNCVFESNTQAGLYFYRLDTSSLRAYKIQNCWFENNYEAYTSGSTSYSVNGNKLFTLGNLSTYIAWTSAYQAGYQFVIDSQTRAGGGPDTFEFNQCYVSGNSAAQKGFFIIAGFKFALRQCVFTSGDTANFLKASNYAEGIMYIDPLMDNNPTTTITSITNGNGIGSTGAYYRMGTTNDGTPSGLGGLYPVKGVFGGPIRFPAPTVGDTRNSDTRTLDDYFEGGNSSFSTTWRTSSSASVFTVNSQTNKVTKIGRFVIVDMQCTVTASGTTSSNDKLFVAGLPYTIDSTGSLVGQAWIQATGGGASVLNNGLTPLYAVDIYSLYGVLNSFPAIAVGHTYDIRLQATYMTTT